MDSNQVDDFCTHVVMFSDSIAAMGEIEGMKAENASRAFNGLSPAYEEGAFEEVLIRYKIIRLSESPMPITPE